MSAPADGRLGWWCDNPCSVRTLGDPRGFVLIDVLPRVSYCGGSCCRGLVLPGFGGAGFGVAGLFCLGVVRGWFVGVRQGCLGAWWAGVGLGSAFLVAVWRCWVLECVVFVMG